VEKNSVTASKFVLRLAFSIIIIIIIIIIKSSKLARVSDTKLATGTRPSQQGQGDFGLWLVTRNI
jgi:hypothetical protein